MDFNTKNEQNNKVKSKRNAAWYMGIVLFAAGLILILFLVRLAGNERKISQPEEALFARKEEQKTEDETAEVHLFQKLEDLHLTGGIGEKYPLEDLSSGPKVLVFWASWCSYCKEELMQIDAFADRIRGMGGEVLLVNKLDGTKETKEQAVRFLKENEIQTETLFDENCDLYETLGLNMIPTVLFVDGKGRIVSMTEGSMPEAGQAEAMLEEAKTGKAEVLSKAMSHGLVNPEGGIRTNVKEDGAIPSGEDVLSESQGILMEYAALAGKEELFERLWGYTEEKLFAEGLMPWVISDKKTSEVNALIDDLRIASALEINKNKSEEYQKAYKNYMESIYTYNSEGGELVDCYDVSAGQKADRFTLCYGDLRTLSKMAEEDGRYKQIYDNTLSCILEGRISEKFPLYYSYYDYEKRKYEGERLNMSEELTTLLHLAEVGALPEEALDWIEEKMNEGCIYAAYDMEGNPAKDGYYESTAVYALVVMTALEAGREDIAGKAINRMEQFRILDAYNEWNGLFGNSDGSGIYSFDQGMALLAYELYERTTE